MAKKNSTFVCQKCSFETPQWIGKCPECDEWNSFEEERIDKLSKKPNGIKRSSALPPSEINTDLRTRTITGISEFDRSLGGGIVQGSLILIGGEPGIGKSTLLTEVLGKVSKQENKKILYISGEESQSQVADRAKRLGVTSNNFFILNENTWEEMLIHIKEIKPSLIVIDSIQTTISNNIQSAPGTISQIREVTYELMNYVKANNLTAFVIGHITKEGNIAGPKILEHMVDTVIYFEGDQFGHYRMLRVIKNRFGNTNEVGLFEMGEEGLEEVKNPSQYFLETSMKGSSGNALTCVQEGTRALFVEIQALVVINKYGSGRRNTQGFDPNRLAMLIAIAEKHLNLALGQNDVYLNIIGGIKIKGRETDLAIVASLYSSLKDIVLDKSIIFLGEVGLTGEIRSVPKIESRIKEMIQLGYKTLVTSNHVVTKFKNKYPGIRYVGISKAKELKGIAS